MPSESYGAFFANIIFMWLGLATFLVFILFIYLKKKRLAFLSVYIFLNLILFFYVAESFNQLVKILGIIVWPILNLAFLIWVIVKWRKSKSNKLT